MVKPAWVNWALLPGTIVSEMAYIFGCLITGGEVRRAKLIEMPGKGKAAGGEPTTNASSGLKIVGAILASLVAMVACIAVILLARELLGASIIEALAVRQGIADGGLPKSLPKSWDAFWGQVNHQVLLLRQICETFGSRGRLDWRGAVFVYLALCLSIRLSPVTRPMRPTLAAVVVIAAAVALVGLAWDRFSGLIDDVWPLLTYIWSSLLFVLVATLLVRGLAGLIGILAGRKA
jgi:hypothetical protein